MHESDERNSQWGGRPCPPVGGSRHRLRGRKYIAGRGVAASGGIAGRDARATDVKKLENIFTRLLWVAACALLIPAVALGEAQTVVQSTRPYWEVGQNDQELGRLCSVGKFNEVATDLYVARFTGPKGAGVLGIAKGTGVNLYDPGHKAVKTEDYFFNQDGSSSCSVYVGGRKKKP